MVLADTSIWADHIRKDDDVMARMLELGAILLHPLVLGEIAMGSLKDRERLLFRMSKLPQAQRARDEDVMGLIERERLFSSGMNYIDAHLLASALITPEARLWTRDKRLREAAERLDVGIKPWGRD
jgi:predicted nucleic acid-binding protein